MSETLEPIVRVIVVNYNAGNHLRRCLAMLQAQTMPRFEAVIVDNGSTDGSLDGAIPDDSRFVLKTMGRNLGFAAANNVGARDARTPWLATLNPDAFPNPEWLDHLLNAARSHPGALMVGSTQILDSNQELYDGTGDCLPVWGFPWRSNHQRPRGDIIGAPSGEVFSPCAAAALYDRRIFENIGGFEESFFCYSEDVDIAFRIRLMGGRCYQAGEAVVRHAASAISGQNSQFAIYHGFRNQLWMIARNMPFPILLLSFPFCFVMAAVLLVRYARQGKAQAVLFGILDGVKGLRPFLASRHQLHRERRVSTLAVARMLTWNPLRFIRRDADVRVWRDQL